MKRFSSRPATPSHPAGLGRPLEKKILAGKIKKSLRHNAFFGDEHDVNMLK